MAHFPAESYDFLETCKIYSSLFLHKLAFQTYKDLISSIIAGYANWFTFAISMATIIALFLVKTYVDPLIKKRCRIPVPYDLFVVSRILPLKVSNIFS